MNKKDDKTTVALSMSKETLAAIDELAAKRHVSRSSAIEWALTAFLNNVEAGDAAAKIGKIKKILSMEL